MFDEFLGGLAADDAAAMRHVVERAMARVPDATEGRSYGVAALRYRDKPLLGLGSSARHLALYPFSPAVVEAVAGRLEGYDVSKGTIRFTASTPVPDEVLDELVDRRRAEIDG